MSDRFSVKLTVDRRTYLHFKRIALGDKRSMNKMFEIMVERWPKLTHCDMPPLPAEDVDDEVPF